MLSGIIPHSQISIDKGPEHLNQGTARLATMGFLTAIPRPMWLNNWSFVYGAIVLRPELRDHPGGYDPYCLPGGSAGRVSRRPGGMQVSTRIWRLPLAPHKGSPIRCSHQRCVVGSTKRTSFLTEPLLVLAIGWRTKTRSRPVRFGTECYTCRWLP